jgi:hypothetical protein
VNSKESMTTSSRVIKNPAHDENAEIYFGDVSSARSDCCSAATWVLLAKTPVVIITGAMYKVNFISAITPELHGFYGH